MAVPVAESVAWFTGQTNKKYQAVSNILFIYYQNFF